MAIRISGNGIDMGNAPVSNLDVGALDYTAVNRQYVDSKVNEGEDLELVRTKRSEARTFIRANKEEV